MQDRPTTVLITRILPEIAARMLKEAGMEVTQWQLPRDMTAEEFQNQAARHDAILTIGANRIDREFLDACPGLKMISQFAVGFDNIDVPEATRRGIPVGNTPDSVTHATADVAFLLMMTVSRKAFFLNRQISLGAWKQFEPVKNLGIELRSKTLGIFGMGRIGVQMALRCKGAFGMDVIYHNRNRNLEGERSTGARWVSFEELLASSDVLTVHSVLSDETRRKFGAAEFSQMRSGSIFINTSRGGVHDEEALLHALRTNIIWGAGLDVTNPEPMAADHPLLSMENVAILPHIGSGTEETRNDMARTAAQNLIDFFRNGSIPYCVNPEVLKR